MRLLGTWTALFVLVTMVTAAGCGSSNIKPAIGSGKMDDKMKSDKMMSGDSKMSGEKK